MLTAFSLMRGVIKDINPADHTFPLTSSGTGAATLGSGKLREKKQTGRSSKIFSAAVAMLLLATAFAFVLSVTDAHENDGFDINYDVDYDGEGFSVILGEGDGTLPTVSAGSFHSLALKSDGTVWAWGDNSGGQLGDGTNMNRNLPVQVRGALGAGYLTDVIAVAAGKGHSLALKSDGTVWAWGANNYGQLGDGTNMNRNLPVQVRAIEGAGHLTNITAIAAGDGHSLALKSDGFVLAWGKNDVGQLGDGKIENRNRPDTVLPSGTGTGGLSGVTAIAAGVTHSLALKSDGTVWAWGANWYGQLGDSTINSGRRPVQVVGPASGFLTDVTAIAAGGAHSLALKSDGTVWAWGLNSEGQLGNGTTSGLNDNSRPVQVIDSGTGTAKLSGVTAIAAGYEYSLSVTYTGDVFAWGRNASGQLGNGTTSIYPNSRPVRVDHWAGGPLTGVTAVSAGYAHSLAMTDSGSVYSWGSNGYGQLGIGNNTQTNKASEAKISTSGPASNMYVMVAAGGSHSLGLKSDGTVWAWGWNDKGQLGDGSSATTRYSPVQVVGPTSGYLTGVIAIAAGNNHSLALKSDGTVYAWGWNDKGQLGDGTNTDINRPVPVLAPGTGTDKLSGVTAIAAGNNHSLALKSDGTVWAWGLNDRGQLGDGTTTDRYRSVQVLAPGTGTDKLSGVTAIAAGGSHSLALKSDGMVWAWGQGTFGQLGDGANTDRYRPVQVLDRGTGTANLSGVTAITAGNSQSFALMSTGNVYAWGLNTIGQLGDGTTTDRNRPVQVAVPGSGPGGITGVIAISAGSGHSLAVTSSGGVYAWGYNVQGELGIGNTANSNRPVKVLDVTGAANLSGVTAVSAGDLHSLALISDGTILAWGYNAHGRLGIGDAVAAQKELPTAMKVLPAITTTPLPNGTVGVYYSQTLTAGGTTPITWSVSSGTLPAGLTLVTTNGVIYGTPTAVGTSTFTIKAENTAGDTTKAFSITIAGTVPVITTASLPDGTIGMPYSETLTATGSLPMEWYVVGGALPAGLTLNRSIGVLSGTPTAVGTFTFTVMAENATGNDTMALTIQIGALPVGPAITTATLPGGTIGVPYSQTLTATGPGITWSVIGSLPAGLTLDPSTGVLSGTPTESGTFNFTLKASNSFGDDFRVMSIGVGGTTTTDAGAGGKGGSNTMLFIVIAVVAIIAIAAAVYVFVIKKRP